MLGQGVLGYYALGEVADTGAAYSVEAAKATFTFTGNVATFGVARAVVAAAGSFTLTGNAATVTPARKIVSAAASFTLTENDAATTATRILYAGTYASPGSVGFGALGEFALGQMEVDEASSFSVVFHPATLRAARPLAAGAGVFTLTGYDAALTKFLGLRADSPLAITVTFDAASITATRRMAVSAGSFSTGGQVIDMARVRRGLSVRSGGGATGLRASSGGGSRGLRIRA